MAAYIFSGDHAYIGLRRREAEAWLSAYVRHYGVDSRELIPSKAIGVLRSNHR